MLVNLWADHLTVLRDHGFDAKDFERGVARSFAPEFAYASGCDPDTGDWVAPEGDFNVAALGKLNAHLFWPSAGNTKCVDPNTGKAAPSESDADATVAMWAPAVPGVTEVLAGGEEGVSSVVYPMRDVSLNRDERFQPAEVKTMLDDPYPVRVGGFGGPQQPPEVIPDPTGPGGLTGTVERNPNGFGPGAEAASIQVGSAERNPSGGGSGTVPRDPGNEPGIFTAPRRDYSGQKALGRERMGLRFTGSPLPEPHPVLVQAGSEEASQHPVALAGWNNTIIADHSSSEAQRGLFSTRLYDVATDGRGHHVYDTSKGGAALSTALRNIGEIGKAGRQAALAWTAGVPGMDLGARGAFTDSPGGLNAMSTTERGVSQAFQVGYAGGAAFGPVTSGGLCKHFVGVDQEGVQHRQGHLNLKSPWYFNDILDCPPLPDAKAYPKDPNKIGVDSEVVMQVDPRIGHPTAGVNFGGGGQLGYWRWSSKVLAYVPPPPEKVNVIPPRGWPLPPLPPPGGGDGGGTTTGGWGFDPLGGGPLWPPGGDGNGGVLVDPIGGFGPTDPVPGPFDPNPGGGVFGPGEEDPEDPQVDPDPGPLIDPGLRCVPGGSWWEGYQPDAQTLVFGAGGVEYITEWGGEGYTGLTSHVAFGGSQDFPVDDPFHPGVEFAGPLYPYNPDDPFDWERWGGGTVIFDCPPEEHFIDDLNAYYEVLPGREQVINPGSYAVDGTLLGGDVNNLTLFEHHWLGMSTPYVLLTPSLWGQGDTRFTQNPTIQDRINLARAPGSILIEAFGAQKNDFEWVKTVESGLGGRFYGGSMNGGIAFCHPEQSMDGLDRASVVSDTWVAIAAAVKLGFGTPHQIGTYAGKLTTGFDLAHDAGNEKLLFERISGSAVSSEIASLSAEGTLASAANMRPGGSFLYRDVDIDNGDSPYTTDYGETVLVDTSAGAVTVNLPTVLLGAEARITIVDTEGNAQTNNITITPNGGETINFNSSHVLKRDGAGVTLQGDGLTNWFIVSDIAGVNGSLYDVMSTRGDILHRNASNVTDRLALGAANSILSSDGTDISYRTLSSLLTSAILSSSGDMLYRNAGGNAVRLGLGSPGYVLTSVGGAPVWQARIGGVTGSTDNALLRADGTAGLTVQASSVTLLDTGFLSGLSGLRMAEQSAAVTALAGFGDFWVKDDAPTNPYFTDDVSTSHPILLAPASFTTGDLLVGSSVANRSTRLGIGSSGQLLAVVSGAPAWVTAGKVAQVVVETLTSSGSTTTAIPGDNTQPQDTEGGQVMTANITPTNANSSILIEAVCFVECNNSLRAANVAMFEDGNSSAVSMGYGFFNASFQRLSIPTAPVLISAGGTSQRTIEMRAGPSAGGGVTLYWNALAGSAAFGATVTTSIKLTEILP